MQILVNELAEGTLSLDPNVVYEVWSPQDEGNVVQTMKQMLEDDKHQHHE